MHGGIAFLNLIESGILENDLCRINKINAFWIILGKLKPEIFASIYQYVIIY